jgi:hypothetical protein
MKGTALLTFDYADPARSNDQWLYLPALRNRQNALDRGRAFLGTDFSFEDAERETQLSLSDYVAHARREGVDGHRCFVGRRSAKGRARAGQPRSIRGCGDLIPLGVLDLDGAPQRAIHSTSRRCRRSDGATHRWKISRRSSHDSAVSRIDYRASIPEEQFSEGVARGHRLERCDPV